MKIKSILFMLLTCGLAFGQLNFDIDQNALPNANIVNSLAPEFTNLTTTYFDISSERNGNDNIMAEEIILRPITKTDKHSSVDLNAKFIALRIMQARLECELNDTGYWDDANKDCTQATSCSDYLYFKTCSQDLSNVGGCSWDGVNNVCN